MGCGLGFYLAGYNPNGSPNCAPITGTGASTLPISQAVQAAGGFTPQAPISGGPVSIDFTDDLNATIAGPGIGPAKGQCPMLPSGDCTNPAGPGTIPCQLIRECDPYTGAQHVQYFTPAGAAQNANIWTVDPGTGKMVWLGPDGNPATPPNWATPPTLGAGNTFLSNVNGTVQTQLQKVGSVAGFAYDPGTGWRPAPGSGPSQGSPSGGSAFASGSNPAGGTTTTGVAPTGVQKLSTPPPSGTAGPTNKTGTTPPGKPNALMLVAFFVVIILIFR